MKNPQKKVLRFPKPPERPKVSTIVVQMFGERFAIHCGLEELPPLPPLLQFSVRENRPDGNRDGVPGPKRQRWNG